jgi:branched-subunit amino acid aminotransferase/4-amino-4-deoxychorismate lyase
MSATDRALWVDGRVLKGAEARASLFDRGVRDGEGLFESIRVEARRPFHWNLHLERLVVAAAELGFPVPPAPAKLANGIEAVLEANRLDDAAVRITVTRGVPGGKPTRAGCWIDAEPLSARLWRGTRAGQGRATLCRVPFASGPLSRYKTTSRLAYHLARDEARVRDADEALLLSPTDELLEGSASNVFVVLRGEIATPPLASGILPGVQRRHVIARCARIGLVVRERPIAKSELWEADEVFVTNVIQQVLPITAIDGNAVPSHTLGTRLRDLVRTKPED